MFYWCYRYTTVFLYLFLSSLMRLQTAVVVSVTSSDLNDLFWLRCCQNRCISSSHDSRHSRVTSKFYTKFNRLLIANLLHVITASYTIFVLTVIEHTCFIIVSHMTPCFAASAAPCKKLCSWRMYMDSSKNKNGLHDFVLIKVILSEGKLLYRSFKQKEKRLSSKKSSCYLMYRQV